MKDLLTRLTMSLGEKIETSENTLYEEKNWKYDVVLTYLVANINKIDLNKKCVQLAKELNLDDEFRKSSYWTKIIDDLKIGNKKELQKEAEKSIKKITRSSSYGCGSSSRSYGCGSSSRSSSYGCGGSSRSYGC